MLQFDLSPLIGARPGERLAFSLDEGPLWLEDIYVVFLRGPVRFTRVQGGILVEGEVEAEVHVECVRCLEPFSLTAALDLEEVVGLGGRPRPGVTYYVTEEGWFDLSPVLREQAWVAVPMKPLCRTDCRGLCPECGESLNVGDCGCSREQANSQWAILASLRTEEQE